MAEFNEQMDPGRRMDQDFTREDYRLRAKIISSEYAQKCIDLIEQYDFSQSCKIILQELVSVNFDPNVVLARNSNVKLRELRFKIALNIAITAMDDSDTANPGLLNVFQAMSDAFCDFVSRSIDGKERDAITKIESSGTQHYTGLQGGQPEQKRGLEIPSFRRGQ